MVDESHVLDLLPAFALGSLESDEALQVERHLLSCWICRREAQHYQTIAEQLSLAVPPVTPPPAMKEQLMRRVRGAHAPELVSEKKVIAERPWLERLLPVWGLASLALVVIMVFFGLALWQRMDRLEVATSPGGMRAVSLNETAEIPGATGFVLVSVDGRNGALVVDGLPPLEESRQYQLWLVRNEQKISGAIFSTDEQSYGGTRIRAPGSLLEYQSATITIEPAGGSSQPTGAPVLEGFLFNP